VTTRLALDEPHILRSDTIGDAWLAMAGRIVANGAPSRYDNLPIREISLVTLTVARPDGSPVPADPTVIVLRMTGQFSVAISAPEGASTYATGTVLAAVLDATTGQVLDFGLDTSGTPLPTPVVAFQR
jgi:hypothetical protein